MSGAEQAMEELEEVLYLEYYWAVLTYPFKMIQVKLYLSVPTDAAVRYVFFVCEILV